MAPPPRSQLHHNQPRRPLGWYNGLELQRSPPPWESCPGSSTPKPAGKELVGRPGMEQRGPCLMAGAFRVIVAPDTHLPAPGVTTRRRLREERMTTHTSSVSGHSPPSYAPENPLHLCEDAPTNSGRGIHHDTGCIYHPSCLSRPTVKTGNMTRSELNSLIHAVRKQRAAFFISGGQS